MEGAGESIRFLTETDICNINHDLIITFGGWFQSNPNLRGDAGLSYVLAAIEYPVYGVDMYPTLIDKAAALSWYIITRHPFHDTNKRTAIEAAIEFLELNGLATHFEPNDVITTAIAASNGLMSGDEFKSWIARNVGHESNY